MDRFKPGYFGGSNVNVVRVAGMADEDKDDYREVPRSGQDGRVADCFAEVIRYYFDIFIIYRAPKSHGAMCLSAKRCHTIL